MRFFLLSLLCFLSSFAKSSHKTIDFFDAVRSNNLLAVEQFLKKNYEIDTLEEKKGYSALHWAAFYDHEHIALLLLERGVSVNLRSHHLQNTAFHIAASKGHKRVSRILLSYEAEFHLQNYLRQTPIDLARKEGFTPMMTELRGERKMLKKLKKENSKKLKKIIEAKKLRTNKLEFQRLEAQRLNVNTVRATAPTNES